MTSETCSPAWRSFFLLVLTGIDLILASFEQRTTADISLSHTFLFIS